MKLRCILSGLVFFLGSALSLAISPGIHSASAIKSANQQSFLVDIEGTFVSVSTVGLNLKANLRKPLTIPQSSEPKNWKINNKTRVFKTLGGTGGNLQTISYLTNIGQVDYQIWISERNDLVAFRQVFTNTSAKPVVLENLYPLFIGGKELFRFGNIRDWRILEQFRNKNDLPGTEVPVAGKTITCDPFFIINDKNGDGRNLFIGFQTFNFHLADISLSFDNDLQLSNISANCDFGGVVIPASGSRSSQWVIIAMGSDPGTLINSYTERIRNYHNIQAPVNKAPSVYCTWYYHALNYNEEFFKKDIAHFIQDRVPFDVFLIDECWDVNRWGDFEPNKSFPGGMKQAADQINSVGYIPGIWTAPFLADRESNLAVNHPEWLLKNSKGILCTFNMNSRDHYILDLTYPGVCDYLEEQFRKISHDWGYRYFKFDFTRAVFIDSDQQFYDRTMTSLEAYRKGLEAIRRGTGSKAYISVCGGHYGASLGIANTQRSGSDVKSRWDEIEIPKYRQNILRTWMSGLWHVDPDAMMVRRQLNTNPDDREDLVKGLFTDDEAFTNAVNQFIGGNLITFTEDFSIIDQDRKMLYKHVIPSVNSSSRPVDIFNTLCPEIMLTQIFPESENLGPWNMVSIINWSDKPKDYAITMDSGITGNLSCERFILYDFQSQEIIAQPVKGDTVTIKGVRGHNSKIVKIIPWDGSSALFLGTDLNFACGGTEISEIRIEGNKISGTLDTPWIVPVQLSFLVPAGSSFEKRQLIMSPGQRTFFLNF